MHAADRHVWVRLPFWLVDFPGLVLDERSAGQGRELLVLHVDVDGRAVLDWRREWEVLSMGSVDVRPASVSASL